jgi:bla regulator protein BlaR1
MIAAWLVYSLAVGALVYAGARALELVAHALDIPTRFIWVAAIAASVALSTRQLVRLANGLDVPTPSLERRIARRVRSTAPVAIVERQLEPTAPNHPIRAAMRAALANGIYRIAQTRGALHRVDVTPLERWNEPLLIAWFFGSAGLAGFFAIAFGRLRDMERDFDPVTVDGVPVGVSNDVGPALFGIIRSRIIVPRWVLDLPPMERRIILVHEGEHAIARDPATLLGALLMLVLQPWNAALWAMLSRLRLAIEMDCDHRVLGATVDARRYGELLVLVHSRRSVAPQSLLPFVERRSSLERRIRRIMSRRPSRPMILGSLVRASLALGIAAWTPGPTPTRHVIATTRVDHPKPPRAERLLGAAVHPEERSPS